jgi:ABC-2 type transport system permease protein
MTAALRYEFRMQARKRSMWIAYAVVVALLGLLSASQLGDALDDPSAKFTMATAAFMVNLILPVAYGSFLADRLVRDDKLGVAPILDATPASTASRLTGKYLGSCAAAAVPLAIIYFGFAVVYAATAGRPVALAWAAALFAVVTVPAVLFVGAFALVVPLLIPAPLFRVLFVGYWFWGNSIAPSWMPTPANSILSPIGAYPIQEIFGYRGPDGTVQFAGPVPGAALNFLRPEATAATAWLSIGVLLAVAALVLTAAPALRARTTR